MPELPASKSAAVAEAPFFAVSERKLLVLSLLTFSLYQFYWFYRNWQIEKRTEHPAIMPVGRSLLVYFFCHAAFRRVSERAVAHGLQPLPAGALTIGWVVSSLMGEIPPPYFFAVFLTPLFMLPVQRAANAVNRIEAPGHDPNDRFTLWNVLWVGVTLLCAALAWLVLRSVNSALGI